MTTLMTENCVRVLKNPYQAEKGKERLSLFKTIQ